uniref:Uncharacterized protein n=1 Tax=Timema bartmani TaxID=61472 RepID=A0A7R9I169_9NEOP|nr:unnamed protein product [Timema bartmani]
MYPKFYWLRRTGNCLTQVSDYLLCGRGHNLSRAEDSRPTLVHDGIFLRMCVSVTSRRVGPFNRQLQRGNMYRKREYSYRDELRDNIEASLQCPTVAQLLGTSSSQPLWWNLTKNTGQPVKLYRQRRRPFHRILERGGSLFKEVAIKYLDHPDEASFMIDYISSWNKRNVDWVRIGRQPNGVTLLQSIIVNSDEYNFSKLDDLVFPPVRKLKTLRYVGKCSSHCGTTCACATEDVRLLHEWFKKV